MSERHTPDEVLRRTPARRLRAAMLAAAFVLSGCYTYVPVDVGAVAPDTRVRAHLTGEGRARVAEILGREPSALDGRMMETRADGGFFLEVPSAYVQDAFRPQALTQRILLERGDFEGVQRRELDRGRTYLLVAAGGLVVGAVAAGVFTGETGGTAPPPGPGGPPEALIPLLRIAVP